MDINSKTRKFDTLRKLSQAITDATGIAMHFATYYDVTYAKDEISAKDFAEELQGLCTSFHRGNNETIGELAERKFKGIGNYDTARPVAFDKHVRKVLARSAHGIVWYYPPNDVAGYPVALTADAEKTLGCLALHAG